MTNTDIKQEMEFIHASIKDLSELSTKGDVKRFAELISDRFDYLKDETNMALSIYENRIQRIEK